MLARSTLLKGRSLRPSGYRLADSLKTLSTNPSYGVKIADMVATHHISSLGSTDPRTGLGVPMILAQSSNAVAGVRNEPLFPPLGL